MSDCKLQLDQTSPTCAHVVCAAKLVFQHAREFTRPLRHH